MTTKRLLLPLVLLGTLLMAAPASAAFTIGLGDQNPATFSNQLFKDLRIKKVRFFTPWDAGTDPVQTAEVAAYLNAARAANQDVLIHFSARRGCFVDGKYLKSVSRCKAPSVGAYTKAFKAFKARFPTVKTYGTWNEANHPSQPINKNPKLAAKYYLALKKNCKGCKVVAGDLLDISNLSKYAKAMNKALKGKAKLWGLHNYADVNRNRDKATKALLKIVPGEVYVTETGGIFAFEGATFPTGASAQAKGIKRMFALANKYDSKRKGFKSKITRLYPYNFREQQGARFDAGLLNPDGTPRPSYAAFKAGARKAKK